jgi:hypothetical protein
VGEISDDYRRLVYYRFEDVNFRLRECKADSKEYRKELMARLDRLGSESRSINGTARNSLAELVRKIEA